MQLVRVHQDQRVNRGKVLYTTITKALGPTIDSANAKRFMGVGLKRIAGDMGAIELNALPPRKVAEAGAILLITELLRHSVHCHPRQITSGRQLTIFT